MDVILLPSNRPPGRPARRRPLAGGLGRIDNDTCWRTVAWWHCPMVGL
jgi:hypothetical protein